MVPIHLFFCQVFLIMAANKFFFHLFIYNFNFFKSVFVLISIGDRFCDE